MKKTNELTARLVRKGEELWLLSPSVGAWRGAPTEGALLSPGESLGLLETLGVSRRLLVPAGAHGRVVFVHEGRRESAVDYATVLLKLDLSAGNFGGDIAQDEGLSADGLAVRAPMSGRVFIKPAPDKPAFVSEGDTVTKGAPVCLIEVMKTFSRVPYDGPGLPAEGKIKRVLIEDGQDVSKGDPLFEIE